MTVSGGPADAAAQDSFCAATSCVITWVYGQSGRGNHLGYQGPGGGGGSDTPAKATSVPTGSAPGEMYMVTSGTHVNSGCCFDHGNAETNSRDNGSGNGHLLRRRHDLRLPHGRHRERRTGQHHSGRIR